MVGDVGIRWGCVVWLCSVVCWWPRVGEEKTNGEFEIVDAFEKTLYPSTTQRSTPIPACSRTQRFAKEVANYRWDFPRSKEIIKFLQETRSLHCLHAAYLICIELKVELFLAPLDFDYSTRKWQGAEEEEEEEEHRDGGYSKWVDGRYKSSVVPFVCVLVLYT